MGRNRVRVLFFLAAAACLAPGLSVSGQERELWQEDWQKFGEAIAPYARDGALDGGRNVTEFNRVFSKDVEWAGTLRRFHSNGVAKFLFLEMPPIRVPLRGGGDVEVSWLSISCSAKANGCEGWSDELVGKRVIFRTALSNRTKGIRPVVRVQNKAGGTQTVSVETHGAELVSVIPE